MQGHVRSRSAPSDADLGGPRAELPSVFRRSPKLKNTPSAAGRGVPLSSKQAMNAAKSSSRMPLFQRRSRFEGASLIRIFKSDFARTSMRVPVRMHKRSGRRSRLTFVDQILFDVQYRSSSIGSK